MMAAEKLHPAPDQIKQHLQHITRRWDEIGQPCKLELVFLSDEDVATVKNVARFNVDEAGIVEAVQHAEAMNRHGVNAYAVVNPVDAERPLRQGARAKREDILASFFHWADADDAQAAENIKTFVGPKCTFFVLTGTVPSPRPHVYWELTEPTRDLDAWSQTQAAIAAALGTDSVIDAPRIMRLAGTVNWPKPKKRAKGYVPELTKLTIYGPDARPAVSSDQMARAFVSAPRAQRLGSTGTALVPFQIDTGGSFAPPLDRERAKIQALSGVEWHKAIVQLTGSYVAKGLSDAEIHALTLPLTLAGYTPEQTAVEVQRAVDGARNKGYAPKQEYASPAALSAPDNAAQDQTAANFDAPKREGGLEWFDDLKPILGGAYIVKGVLDAGAMSVVYGPSNSGKTFWALDLVYHIAIGAIWRSRRVVPSSVLYLAAEGGRGLINRVASLKHAHGVMDVPLAVKRAGLDLLHDQADLQHIVDLSFEVQARNPNAPHIIVVDTLSRIMAGGDENSAADMTALIRNIDAIRATTGAHIMLVHHTGKDTARGARGHSSLRAATDTEIEVSNENGARAAIVTKQREHQGGETFAFTLKPVSLGYDTDGDEVTSCVIEVADGDEYTAAKKAAKGRGKNQQIIMEAFDQMLSEGLATGNPGGVGMPEPGQFWAVDAGELRTIAQGKMVGENASKLFRTAWDALTGPGGIFVSGNNQAWRIDRRKSK